MNLAANLAIAAGIIIEILLLWETSDRQKNIQPAPGIIAPGISRLQEIIALTVLVSWILIAVAEFFNPPLSLIVLSGIQGAIMFPAFAFLFAYGMVVPKLLPRVNEQTIVVITAIVLLSLVGQTELTWYSLAALAVPIVAIFLMALTMFIMPPALKSLYYFWYLICLLAMAYQSNFDLFFNSASADPQTSFDYFIAGAAGIFLLLHSIFLVRFFLMLTANILPKNRYLIKLAMPQLFSDEQMPRYKFLVILLLVVIVLWANRQFGFFPDLSLSSLLILFAVHFMDRSFKITGKL
ncbi:MAG: hypothetical protein CVU44_19535 [Chloroflexi bacterium HGW-Chloroflexi-6]|nr:MAG: hypothetical protein CVU44_19535 [Chloroflexi bacterium HGW-Chloroflexi-6]